MRHAHVFICALYAGVGLGTGCSGVEDVEAKSKGERPPALVSVATIADETIRQAWSYLGEVRAGARAEVAAGADGAVTRVTVREGDAIRQGQLLLEVDPALAAA
ncbi:MAG: biotin/lipoyl-binding protein, partial [Myxococcota bacterium]